MTSDRWTVLFLSHVWAAPLLWTILHSADYLLTVATSAYRRRVGDRIRFEGSIEVNPLFQKPVDRVQWLSPRFLFSLIAVGLLLLAVVALLHLLPLLHPIPEFLVDLFVLMLGVLVFSRVSIICAHLTALFRLRLYKDSAHAQGELLLSRRAAVLLGVPMNAAQAALLAVATILSPSWWLAGGVLGLTGVALFYLVHGLRAPTLPAAPGS